MYLPCRTGSFHPRQPALKVMWTSGRWGHPYLRSLPQPPLQGAQTARSRARSWRELLNFSNPPCQVAPLREMPLREGPLPSVSQSIRQSVRQGPRRTFLWPSDKTPSILLPLPFFSFAPGLSHYSFPLLIPSSCTGTDTAGILCDHHPVRAPLALVLELVLLNINNNNNNNTVFCKYCGTRSSLIKPLLKLQGLGSTHSLQNVPRPGSRVLAAQLKSPTQLHSGSEFSHPGISCQVPATKLPSRHPLPSS